jgi:hypothetical protein
MVLAEDLNVNDQLQFNSKILLAFRHSASQRSRAANACRQIFENRMVATVTVTFWSCKECPESRIG